MNDETRLTIDPARAGRLLRLATYASVTTATVLIAGKLAAALMTGSVSVLASLVDSMMDVAASLINLLAVHYSLQPPDQEHRFGHGKAEPLAGLVQAAFIAGSAVFLILHAVDRLLHPQPMNDALVGVGVLLFSIAATVLLLAFQHYVIRRTHSTAIRADALHYATDLLTNGATIVALGLAMLGWPLADPVFAIGIALYILYSAGHIGHEAIQLLMDHELPPEVHGRIKEIACGHHAGARHSRYPHPPVRADLFHSVARDAGRPDAAGGGASGGRRGGGGDRGGVSQRRRADSRRPDQRTAATAAAGVARGRRGRSNQQRARGDEELAERVGFEPTDPRGSTVFKTVAIDRSATSPNGVGL